MPTQFFTHVAQTTAKAKILAAVRRPADAGHDPGINSESPITKAIEVIVRSGEKIEPDH